MKKNKQLEFSDLRIDPELDIDFNTNEISVYLETWFDVDRKFDLHINDDDDTWLNMYARFNPFEDTLKIDCVIDSPNNHQSFEYKPTDDESTLIKNMIKDYIYIEYGENPKDFIASEFSYELKMGGLQ